jgi:hypothetical protein
VRLVGSSVDSRNIQMSTVDCGLWLSICPSSVGCLRPTRLTEV